MRKARGLTFMDLVGDGKLKLGRPNLYQASET
jgi:hypothetical protein